jgi:hypothetical protein
MNSNGHNIPCYYCGEPCNSFHPQPTKWPIPLTHRDLPGVVRWHHSGCVSDRLIENGSHEEAARLRKRMGLFEDFLMEKNLYKEWTKFILEKDDEEINKG